MSNEGRHVWVKWTDDFQHRIKLAALTAKIELAELVERAVEREVERMEKEQGVKHE